MINPKALICIDDAIPVVYYPTSQLKYCHTVNSSYIIPKGTLIFAERIRPNNRDDKEIVTIAIDDGAHSRPGSVLVYQYLVSNFKTMEEFRDDRINQILNDRI